MEAKSNQRKKDGNYLKQSDAEINARSLAVIYNLHRQDY